MVLNKKPAIPHEEHLAIFKKITEEKQKFFELFDSQPRDLGNIKQGFNSLLEIYHQYFSKINESQSPNSNSEILKSFLSGGNLQSRINELQNTELDDLSRIAKNIFFLFNKLIFDFEKSTDQELDKAKIDLFLTLQQFPGTERFVCLNGVSGRVVDAIQSQTNKTLDRIFLEKKS